MQFRNALGQKRFTPRRALGWFSRQIRDNTLVAYFSLRNKTARSSILGNSAVVVSLTTYGPRLKTVHLTIESISSGSAKPSRLVLWLDERTRSVPLPPAVTRLQKRGLDVQYTKDFRPHTKYFPYILESQATVSPLVTADDDVLYPSSWLASLVTAAKAAPPKTVVCHRAQRLQLNDDGIQNYRTWSEATDASRNIRNVATGVSGVYYSLSFQQALLAAGSEFDRDFATADDLWLHLVGLRSGFSAKQLNDRPGNFPTVPRSQKVSLVSSNLLNGNDASIKAGYSETDVALLRETLESGGVE